MPRKTNLRFTADQESELIAYLTQTYDALQQDNRERIENDLEAWSRYELDVRNRSSLDGNIWRLSNLTIPAFAMICEHFVSRCEEATVGDTPFFHFEAVNVGDEAKRLTYDRYFNWKIADQGKTHEDLLESNLPTFVQSATILKATYLRDEATWAEYDIRVLHDAATKEPIEILDHGPIIEGEDQFIDQPDPISVIAGDNPVRTRQHLEADPTFVFDQNQHYWDFPANGVNRRHMLYCGPKTEQVSSDRFFCPMDAASVDSADIVMELSDKNYAWFQAMWVERPWARWADWAPRLRVGNNTPKTQQRDQVVGALNPPQQPPENRSFDTLNPVRRVAEFWVRRDVLGDGERDPQDFVCYLDLDLKCLVYYEWVAKVCPDMKRPYTVVSLSRRPNRWCGKSIWWRAKRLFEAVDRMFNGEYYRTLQQANPPKGGDKDAAKEEPDSIEFDPTKYYDLKAGRTIDDLIQYAKVPDTNQRTQMVLEFIIFWIQLWLGVSSLSQGDYSAGENQKTAYGIERTLREASVLGRRWIRRKLLCDEEHLTKLVKIAIATLPKNAVETYEYTDGDVRQLATLAAAEIRTLNIHVKVVEEQRHEENDIERCNAALAVQERYFAQFEPKVRLAMKPLLDEILVDLGFKNPDELLPLFTAMPLVAEMMGGAPTKDGMGGVAGGPPPAAEQNPPAPEGAGSNPQSQ